MTSFDFTSEMVYGKKHLNHVKYDSNKFDFISLASEMLSVTDLSALHDIKENEYPVFTEFGKDNNTEFHNLFYQNLKTEKGDKIKKLYTEFVREVVLPYLNLEEAMVQKFPSFRVQLPDNVAVAKPHFDHSLGHPIGEVNFIIALTKMSDTSTVIIEKMPRSRQFEQMNLEANSCISFNGNLCEHYNQLNKTGKTRVSMDFRVLPLNYYDADKAGSSVSTQQKFVEGGYYHRLSVHD